MYKKSKRNKTSYRTAILLALFTLFSFVKLALFYRQITSWAAEGAFFCLFCLVFNSYQRGSVTPKACILVPLSLLFDLSNNLVFGTNVIAYIALLQIRQYLDKAQTDSPKYRILVILTLLNVFNYTFKLHLLNISLINTITCNVVAFICMFMQNNLTDKKNIL